MLKTTRCLYLLGLLCTLLNTSWATQRAHAQQFVDPNKFKRFIHDFQKKNADQFAKSLKKDSTKAKKSPHLVIPLHQAVMENDPEKCQQLLENGASLTKKNQMGLNAIQIASQFNKDRALHSLLTYQKNSLINLKKAIFSGNKKDIEKIIQNGTSLSQSDLYGFTPLHYAAMSGHLGSIEQILRHPIDLEQKDFNGKTALHHASFHHHASIVLALLNHGARVNSIDHDGITPLHECAITNDLRTCSILIQHGADPHQTDRFGKTAQDDAFEYNHPKMHQMLLKKGHRPIKKINQSFLEAAEKGDLPALKKLAIHANINASNQHGQTALHLAVKNNHIKTATWLLEHHAKVNARKIDQETPLHEAAWAGKPEMIDLLLDHGAFIDAVNRYQMTPLQIASWEGHLAVVKRLTNNELPPELNADPNLLNQHGWTALHFATKYNHNDIVEWLLTHHVDPNIQERLDGNTALHQAIIHHHLDIAQTLLEHGAKINIKNKKAFTALELSQRMTKHHPEFERTILKHMERYFGKKRSFIAMDDFDQFG